MAYPDFILIGAMKCGTSTLAAQLGVQDGVFMSTPKEPNFFSDDEVYAQGLDWYGKLFNGAASDDLKGEASTHYTKLPTYPKTVDRMKAVLDKPRLVYMVRDPVERAISHFIHEWTEGRMENDPVGAFDRHPELIEYGLYAKQLAPFIAAYGQDAVCLTSLERLKTVPQEELTRICSHIGLTKQPTWQDDIGAQNVSAERIRKLPMHDLIVDNAVATLLRRILVPKQLRSWIRQARSYGERPQISDDLRTKLATRFAEDQAELVRLYPNITIFPSRTKLEEHT